MALSKKIRGNSGTINVCKPVKHKKVDIYKQIEDIDNTIKSDIKLLLLHVLKYILLGITIWLIIKNNF